MSKRLSFPYLTLVVAAFMVGLGNVWKFPSLIIKYGLGGLAVYIASVVVLTGIPAAAIETTKRREYEIVEYFHREYGRPAFALPFLVVDVLLIGYYSVVGGWTLSSVILGGTPNNMLWNMGMGLAFILLLFIVLLTGKERTLDFMAASFVLFLIAMSLIAWEMHREIGSEDVLVNAMRNVLVWRGITWGMAVDMASQAAYSLGIGMGVYLILGTFLPEDVSGPGVVAAGAVMDTLMALGGLLLVVLLTVIEPSSSTSGSTLLFRDFPAVIRAKFGTGILYAFNLSLFLAAITSMVPIGEVTGRVTAEITGFSREDGLVLSLSAAMVVAILVSVLTWTGFNPVEILDGTVSTFILLGGIIEAYAVVAGRGYIPGWLKAWGWIGIFTAASLGFYAFASRTSRLSRIILVVVAFFALSLNGRLRRSIEFRRKRLLRKRRG